MLFSGGCGNSGSYATQFYKDQTNGAAADSVQLIAGQTTAGINAISMLPGGTITGVVTDNTGHKLSNVCVRLASQAEEQTGPFFFGGESRIHQERCVHGQEPGSWAVRRGLRLWFRLR